MTPERHQKLEELFHTVLEVEPSRRAALMDRLCAGDQSLRTDLQALVDSHERAEEFIAAPAFELAASKLSAPAPRVQVGARLGHYEILSMLGAGGMGEVYLALDTRLGRKAALKVLPPHISTNQDLMNRFVREAQLASRLNHPNIATIYDIAEADGIRFIAMEYIEGATLSAKISGRQLDLAGALDASIQIADALAAAHTQGITHRDIKPDNIMIRPDGRVKVLDFGLAKLTEPSLLADRSNAPTMLSGTATQTGFVMGTVRYMSPEQARGETLDARTDIFSLGIVLYEMVTGSAPFAGRTTSDVIASLLTREIAPPSHQAPAVPGELDRIVAKALRKGREDRYQTMQELMSDLKALQSGKTAVVNPEPRARRIGLVVPLVVVLALVILAAAYLIYRGRGQTINSLAVMPFTNISGNGDTEYLSDGLSDSVINNLSQLSNLKVASLSSVLRFKGRQFDAQQVGRELNVSAILTGRLIQRNDMLLVSAELVDARDGRRIWGEQYNRKLADILELQAEISRNISDRLTLRLSSVEQQRMSRVYTTNADAYKAYLEGHYLWNKFTPDSLRKSISYYEEAIRKDPSYALAYSGLADSYVVLGVSVAPPNEVFPKAKEAAMKALSLDESLGAAHISLGAYKLFYEWDWAGAEQEAKRAKELNPSYDKAIELNTNYGGANHYYCQYLDVMGRADEAIQEMTRALQFDPLAFVLYGEMGYSHYIARHYDRAIEASRKALDRDPTIYLAHQALGDAFQQQGRYDEAIEELRQAKEISNNDPWMEADLGNAYGAAGKRQEALDILRDLQDRRRREYISPYFTALIYVGLGEKERALEWLQKAYEDRSALMTWLRVEPKLDSLRSDRRFNELERHVGFGNP
jgi:eukaryotic-like serine/threonine-protein kinase